MGYKVEELLNSTASKRYNRNIKALEYLWVLGMCYSDKNKMLEISKNELKHMNTEENISWMITAIKVIKRNLTIKIGIKHDRKRNNTGTSNKRS